MHYIEIVFLIFAKVPKPEINRNVYNMRLEVKFYNVLKEC